MADQFVLECNDCGAAQAKPFSTACESCGGLIEARYKLESVKLRHSDDPYQRYFDLIPVRDERLLPEAKSTRPVPAPHPGQRPGLTRLYLKDETTNPTATTKDRMAAVSLAYLHESGVTH